MLIVLVQYGAKTLDRTFTYHVPDSLIDEVKVGMKVYVPFGAPKDKWLCRCYK